MKKAHKFISLIMMISIIASLLASMAYADKTNSVKAKPVQITLSVGGHDAALWTYEIDGGVYFKLRDIAKIFALTDEKFDISLDGSQITLVPGEDYSPNGMELCSLSGEAEAYPSYFSFYSNGFPAAILAYNVDGSNFVKLTDIAASLGFGAS